MLQIRINVLVTLAYIFLLCYVTAPNLYFDMTVESLPELASLGTTKVGLNSFVPLKDQDEEYSYI